jgi:DNA mismatch repair protein MutS
LLILTGPNMAGKSTYIRQIALLSLLAQTGSYVPAKSMRLTPIDRIFARVGASDELARGHSTFMVEMVETSRILNNATAASLVILDEVGRGTSTYDGLSLAWAITEHIVERLGCRTLFATHYHELTELADRLPHVKNYNVAVSEQLRPGGAGRDVAFLHKIVAGAADRSYGVHVAEMAGLPKSVTKRSEKILADLELRFQRAAPRTRGASKSNDPDQLMLFNQPDPTPASWRETMDRLAALDANAITPIEALNLIAELKATIERDGH